MKVKVLVTQSCPILCDPMDYSPPGSSLHGDTPVKNTGVGCHFLLQRIFPTQGSNPGLLHCRQILYLLSYEITSLMSENWPLGGPKAFPSSSVGKESACSAGDQGSIPQSGRSLGDGKGNPIRYSCLENFMDRGAWWATIYGVPQSRT